MAAEDVVTYPRSIGGVKVAVLLREEAPGRVKVSLRGKGEVPVNRIAGRFGGGGHENAAGCTVPGLAGRRHRHRARGGPRGPRRARPVTAARPGASRSGILAVEKGPGVTSFQVVAHLRRLLRAPKVGHGGTLDPDATGLLPILIGEAHQAHAVSHRRSTRNTWPRRGSGSPPTPRTCRDAVLTTRPVPAARRAPRSRRRSPASWARSSRSRPCTRRSTTRAVASTSWPAKGAEVERAPRRVTVHAITLESLALPELDLSRAVRQGHLRAHARRRPRRGAWHRRGARAAGAHAGGALPPRGRGAVDGAPRGARRRRALAAPPAAGLRPRRPARAARSTRAGPRPSSTASRCRRARRRAASPASTAPTAALLGVGAGQGDVVKPERLLHADPPRTPVLPG